jgi:putative transposase
MKKGKTNYFAPFEPAEFYHVYNRTNNKEPLFLDDADREVFLKKYAEYLAPFVHTFAYCLLGNHFHLLIAVKTEVEIVAALEQLPKSERSVVQKEFLIASESERSIEKVVSAQFSRLFISYAVSFNNKWKRSGNLLHRPFKRVLVQNDDHLVWLVYYINSNPRKHKIRMDFENYPWSSFLALASDKPTNLNRQNVHYWFGGWEAFLKFHFNSKVIPGDFQYLELEDE